MMLICVRKSKLAVLAAAVAAVLTAGVVTEVSTGTGRPAQTQASEAQLPMKRLVVIDPGHGGMDGGAVGVSGVMEKDVNLQLSQKLAQKLGEANVPYIMTREEDVSIHDADKKTVRDQKRSDLTNRRRIIEESGCTVFVSIHMNKFEQSKYRGAQVFYSSVNPDSKLLAQMAKENILEAVQDGNTREIKQADSSIFLLKYTTMPAILIECGFLSNPEEEQLLTDGEYQDKIADAICKTITEWYSAGGYS